MTFSIEWEQRFAAGGSHSVWPWSDLISMVMRYCKPREGMRVLELGCGVGANARFFLEYGCTYFAIEGSAAATATMRERLPELKSRLCTGDFTKGFDFEGPFDLIVDRSAVTHNPHSAIEHTLSMSYDALADGGHYIGIDWFSSAHGDAAGGLPFGDDHTRTAFESGQFAGVGAVHFADEDDMRSLFSRFAIRALERKTIEQRDGSDRVTATWNVVAQRLHL